jgi:hypothetical protein
VRIEIEEAQNGWVIRSNETRREPNVFEFDGNNRFKTSLENIVVTAERALNYILSEMVGSSHYRVEINEDIEDAKNGINPRNMLSVESDISSISGLSSETLPGGFSPSTPVDAEKVFP